MDMENILIRRSGILLSPFLKRTGLFPEVIHNKSLKHHRENSTPCGQLNKIR